MPILLVKFPDEMSKKVNMSRFLSKYHKIDISVVVNVQLNEIDHVLEVLKRNNCKVIVTEEIKYQILKPLVPLLKNIRNGNTDPDKLSEYLSMIEEKYDKSIIDSEVNEILNLCEEFIKNPTLPLLNNLQNKVELIIHQSVSSDYYGALTIDLDTYLMLYHVYKGILNFNESPKFNRYRDVFIRIFKKYNIIDENFNVVSDWKEKVRVLFDRVNVKGTNLDPENNKGLKVWYILRNLQDYLSIDELFNKLDDINIEELNELINELLTLQLIFERRGKYKTRELGDDLYNFINKQIEKKYKFKPIKIIPKECQDYINILTQIALIDLSVILKRAKKPIKRITFHRLTINFEKYY